MNTMGKNYMGPDGETFSSRGTGREELKNLEKLGKEFNLFVEALYQAKKNFSDLNGYAYNVDDMAIMRLYEERASLRD